MPANRRYTASPLIYPVHHASGAPHTGIVYGRALRAAYAATQHHALKVIEMYYPLDLSAPSARERGRQTLVDNVLRRIAEGYRTLQCTHLIAEVTYSILSNAGLATSYHLLGVTEPTAPDTEESAVLEFSVPVTAGLNTRQRRIDDPVSQIGVPGGGNYTAYGPRDNTFIAKLELELPSNFRNATCEVYVEANAEDGGDEIAYLPQHIVVWGETRETLT